VRELVEDGRDADRRFRLRSATPRSTTPSRGASVIAPSTPGTYALLFCSRAARIRVGALGEVRLPAGSVVYVGSAFGPGGLAGRLRHHLRPVARPRWHLDYLRPALELRGVWLGEGPRRAEHQWAGWFAGLPAVSLPHPRFGASDCRCRSHLFHWRRPPGRRRVEDGLRAGSDAGTLCFLRASQLRAWVAAPPIGTG
jgi:Uri superfamily endonuclease